MDKILLEKAAPFLQLCYNCSKFKPMKNLLPTLMLCLLAACRKTDDTHILAPVPPEFPESWGMKGTIGDNAFEASSLNAALILDTTNGTYVLNVNGWHKDSDQTVYLCYRDFSFQSANYPVTVSVLSPDSSFAYYEKDHAGSQFGKGTITIYSTVDTLIKGMYDFTTASSLKVKGVFTIKPHMAYE